MKDRNVRKKEIEQRNTRNRRNVEKSGRERKSRDEPDEEVMEGRKEVQNRKKQINRFKYTRIKRKNTW